MSSSSPPITEIVKKFRTSVEAEKHKVRQISRKAIKELKKHGYDTEDMHKILGMWSVIYGGFSPDEARSFFGVEPLEIPRKFARKKSKT